MVTRLIAGAGFAVVWSLFCAFLAKYELKKVYEKLLSSEKNPESESEDGADVVADKTEIQDKTFDNRKMYIFGAVIVILNVLLSIALMMIYKETPIIEHVKRLGLLGLIEVAAVTDKQYNIIPNDLIKVGIAFRIVMLIAEVVFFKKAVLSILVSDAIGILAVVIIVLVCLLFMKGSVGMGDLKLMMLMAFCQGIDGFTASGMCSLLVAFFVAVYYLITKKKDRKDSMAFAPFLAIGSYLGIFLTGL